MRRAESAPLAPAGSPGSAEARARSPSPPLLEVRSIAKRFGGTQALAGVSLSLRAGEILALLGENGAGKSTLIKILAGIHTPDDGAIHYCGEDVTRRVRKVPIRFIHQDLGLIEWMTVAENIGLSLGYPARFGLIDWRAARSRAAEALSAIGVALDPDSRVRDLSRTEKSLVAISRALIAKPRILVLDEPTASLPASEVARLFESLRYLKAQAVAMIYVSHRIDEVFEIADRMVVLRDGRVAGDRLIGEVSPKQAIELIVGREPAQIFRRPPTHAATPRLRLEALICGATGPVDAVFGRGEVVGLVGLRGAGQEAIGRALFGLAPIKAGRILLDDQDFAPHSPRAAMAAGVDLIWGDRTEGSIVATLSIAENFFLNPLAAGLSPFAYLAPRREMRAARALGATVGLRPNDPTLPIEALSGGNQQKVVIGRWLHLAGQIYVFEDPTAGVDVGAKAEIYRLFELVTARGATILIVSTDFEEVANVCHRALVFDRGHLVAEIAGPELSVNALLTAASARSDHAAP